MEKELTVYEPEDERLRQAVERERMACARLAVHVYSHFEAQTINPETKKFVHEIVNKYREMILARGEQHAPPPPADQPTPGK